MVDRTSNNNLPLPSKGSFEGTWGTDIMNNDMTDKLETAVPIRDFESNLTDYTPHDGAKFEATDTEVVYYGDGSSWNKADTSGQDPTFNTVTATDGITTESGATINGAEASFGTLADLSVALDTSTTEADEDSFSVEFADQAGTSPAATIKWLRDAANGYAFKVTDTTNATDILTVHDNTNIDLHGNDAVNVNEIYGGDGTGGSVNYANRNIKTGGGTWTVRDTTNGVDIARFVEAGGLEIANGGIHVIGGDVTFDHALTVGSGLDLGATDIQTVDDIYTSTGDSYIFAGNSETSDLYLRNRHLGQTFLQMKSVDTTVNAPNGLNSNGNPVPYSSTGTEYDIQKNGTDGAGIINFKTE